MTAEYFAMLTDVGAAKVADSIANGTPIVLAQIAVGDGEHTPDGSETALVNQRWIGDISSVSRDQSTPTLVKAELTIPTEDGGWWVKEIGVFDADGDLFAVAKCPPSYKPVTAEGSPKPMPVRFYLYISVDANVDLFTGDPEDPASIGYVQNLLAEHAATPHTDFEPGNIVLLGTATPPTGWTKVDDWTNNAMIVFTAGDPGAGGDDSPTAYDPAVNIADHAAHTHDVPEHRHAVPNHLHKWYDYRSSGADRSFDAAGAATNLTLSGSKPSPAVHIYMLNSIAAMSNKDLYTNFSGPGNTDYSGVLTTGNPSATLSHNVGYNSFAPKYRSVIAIRKEETT